MPKYGIEPGVWLARARHAFATVDFRGKTVLDVGSGVGWGSYFAAVAGAKRVVSLEPEADGSHGSMLSTALAIRDDLDLSDIVEIVPSTIEEVDLNETFDVVMLVNSINHLNEPACVVLDHDPAAQTAYRETLAPVAELCAIDGQLLVTDCTNRNLFGDLGLKSPLCPTIEWEKHQPPEVWAALLSDLGFRDPRVEWTPHARLGLLGRVLSRHRALAYLAFSHFRLTMVRAAN